MAALDPAARLQVLEQQLATFERAHDETIRQLRADIAALRVALGSPAALDQAPAAAPGTLLAEAHQPLVDGQTGDAAEAPVDLADDPDIVEAAVEEVVEASLQQTVSRRELFGRRRTDDDDD